MMSSRSDECGLAAGEDGHLGQLRGGAATYGVRIRNKALKYSIITIFYITVKVY